MDRPCSTICALDDIFLIWIPRQAAGWVHEPDGSSRDSLQLTPSSIVPRKTNLYKGKAKTSKYLSGKPAKQGGAKSRRLGITLSAGSRCGWLVPRVGCRANSKGWLCGHGGMVEYVGSRVIAALPLKTLHSGMTFLSRPESVITASHREARGGQQLECIEWTCMGRRVSGGDGWREGGPPLWFRLKQY